MNIILIISKYYAEKHSVLFVQYINELCVGYLLPAARVLLNLPDAA